ncbi:YqaE/Pmp3 family membrane protein [Brevibacillus laterosporus]|nr:YqaE/Pmp3 family membrane protein [Brevibacillus laterosporus]AYB38483.1 YqaE/Pmp3 family membrane protein [Brevibacillus laterosporus]NKQ18468.1 YqaE/Pmp3 family membrane protein [Brevibacillus laterosporus]WNX33236.1 YqaE/Pmp3 family membrane protein [Brevibacillus laterosporus]
MFAGRPDSALLNVILTLFFWVPGVIHAILDVNDAKAEKETNS